MHAPSRRARSVVVHAVAMIAATIVALATPACRTASTVPPHGPASERPNIIFIMADDLGPGEVGAYGQRWIRTPEIDRLAAEGMRFTAHYAGAPVCAPSRAVLLTGRGSPHAIIRDNREVGGWGPDEPEGQMPLPEGTDTIARRFQSAGYATAAIGKWGLGGPGSTGMPDRQGFDLFHGYLCQRVAHNLWPTHLWRNGTREDLPGNVWGNLVGETYAHDVMIEEALAFIDRHREQPFLLYLPLHIPHLALQVPQEEIDAYADLPEDGPYDGSRGYLPHPTPRRAYAGMVTRMDRDIGRLMRRLDEHGLSDRTIVVFTSDNGPTFDVGGADSDFFDSAEGRSGRKGSVSEGGLRVPLIVRWPGRIPAGTSSDAVTAFRDWMPTLCDLAGVPGPDLPPDVGGLSLRPVLLAEGELSPRPFLAWEFPGYGAQQAVRMGRWKGVRRNMRRGGMAIELYDLDADPAETTDLAAEHPAVVAEIDRIMREQRTPSEAFPMPGLDVPVVDPPAE
ncbi:MAG: arylsulfatase [Planctomycetota bacterium]|jgi:arylsulfatase